MGWVGLGWELLLFRGLGSDSTNEFSGANWWHEQLHFYCHTAQCPSLPVNIIVESPAAVTSYGDTRTCYHLLHASHFSHSGRNSRHGFRYDPTLFIDWVGLGWVTENGPTSNFASGTTGFQVPPLPRRFAPCRLDADDILGRSSWVM